jgi:hypothetical protein
MLWLFFGLGVVCGIAVTLVVFLVLDLEVPPDYTREPW